MRSLFNRQIDMLGRVAGFYRRQAQRFPSDRLAGELFAVIAALLPQLMEMAGAHEAGAGLTREGLKSKAEARAELFDCLDRINQTVRSMARVSPKIREKFQIPYSASDVNLIGKAIGIASNAETMKDAFLAHDMDPDFLDELNAAIKQFKSSIGEYNEAKGTKGNARASFERTIETAMDAAYRLDGIVCNTLRNDYPTLMEWESARRVARARTTAKPVPETTTTTTATT
jgi:hypothetical protein